MSASIQGRHRLRGRYWSLVCTHTMNDFQVGASAALLPYFVSEQDYTYAAAAGLILAATSISSIAEPLFGVLSDRYPLRSLILIGMLTAAAGIAIAGLTTADYTLTWIAFAVSGIGVAAYHPPATVHARATGGGTNRSMSIFSVGGNVGAAIAPILVGLTVGTLGLSATPLLLIPTIIAAAFYLLAHRQPAAPPSAANEADAPASNVSAVAPRDLWGLFTRLLVVVCLWSMVFVGTRSFVALYMTQRFHVDDATGAGTLTIYIFAATLGTLTGGFLADRFGRRTVIISGYLLAAIATGALALAPTYGTALALAALAGWALFLPFALHVTLAHSYLPRHLGTASGLALGLSTTIGGLLTPALGALADTTSIRTVFLTLTLIAIAAFVGSIFVTERPATEPEDEPQRAPDDLSDKALG